MDSLKSLAVESATVAIELESTKTGNTLAFIAELRAALQRHESDLQARIREAKTLLPKYSPDVLEEVRMEDEEYVARKHRKAEEMEAYRARQRKQEEARRRNRTRHAVVDSLGVQTGWDIYENGVKVGYQEANWVEVS